MKRILMLALSGVVLLAGCHRKDEPNKIIDGFQAGSTETVLPADAARQFLVMERDMLRVVVPVISKVRTADLEVPELTPAGGGQYTFQTAHRLYGQATWTVGFRDPSNATIDPVPLGSRALTDTLQSLTITGAAASAAFPTITQNSVLTLSITGVSTSTLRLTGTCDFSGSGYALNFQLDPSGAKATFDGLTDNAVTATGTGGTPPATASLNLIFNSDRSMNGPITWEGREGSIHVEDNGSGFVVEPSGRILLE